MAPTKKWPGKRLHEPQRVVMKILGQIGVIGDNQRQTESSAVFSATEKQPGNAQKGWIGNMNEVGLEIGDSLVHGGAGQGQAQLGIEEDRVPL